MTTNQKNGSLEFSLAGRRYAAPAQRESRASGLLGPGQAGKADSFRMALAELSSEDEELPGVEDQGPIVFKNGVFQIDMKGNPEDSALDPALKGLIDSILGPNPSSEGTKERR
jgi:hypothetical protein